MRWSILSLLPRPTLPLVDRLRRRRRRQQLGNRWRFSLLLVLALPALAHATSVVPPAFPELVKEADAIVRASVDSVASRWVDSGGTRVIKTFVTLRVQKRLKGAAPESLTLEFLGGSVGGDTLTVSGMPVFHPGEEQIVFVRGNGLQFCPLVRLGHGRYHVRHEPGSGRRFMARNDETPLHHVRDVELPEDHHGVARAFRSPAEALTPEQFENEITREIAARAP